ncbi:hypothetical protein GCM10010218_01580 [Streptomyces mashuensis]|uniref:histidine kinase n=1 Tax=Streptomyces mashuensis TaxID=33904 RepID=A0A919E8X5_9ACTN|nr:histidine kinase [Streptomyces mashuensis]GHF24691.1 hypothetical protein GCM10010218_01580 [Streptomyces mashuensis]
MTPDERRPLAALRLHDAHVRRIERDLHDGAQARLAVLLMRISHVTRRAGDDAAALRELLEEARHEIARALDDIRGLLRGIRPPLLADRGLAAAVAELTAACSLPVSVDCRLDGRPGADAETAAYFIVAESLTNAVKHAAPTRIRVHLARCGDRLVVEVTDDGTGGAAPGSGSGLRGLADRAAVLGGTFRLTSPPGGPTTVRAVLPWAAEDSA